MEQDFTVELTGGSPWGFALQGGLDHRSPLMIGRVTPGGRASKAGLLKGDYILSINEQPTKTLKHLEAQQLIKKSTTSVILHCTKIRPGILSPAVLNKPPPVFSFPTTAKQLHAKVRPFSAPIKKPPPPASASGHTRMGSLDTPSDSTCSSTVSVTSPVPAATPPSATPQEVTPPAELPNVEVYDVKFTGMECGANQEGVVEPVEAPPIVDTDGAEATNSADTAASVNETEPEKPVEQEIPDDIDETHEEAGKVNDVIVKEEEEVNDVIAKEEEVNDVIAKEEEVNDVIAKEEEVNDVIAKEEEVNEEEEVNNGIAEEEEVNDGIDQNEEEIDDITAAVENIEKEVGELQQEISHSPAPQEIGDIEQAVAADADHAPEETKQEVKQEVFPDKPQHVASGSEDSTEGRGRRRRSQRNSFTKRELCDVINLAAHKRASSSNSSRDEMSNSLHSEPEHALEPSPQPPAPPTSTVAPPTSTEAPPTAQPAPVIKPTLTKKNEAAPLLHKEPGWYQQMFQTFSNKVEEAFPAAGKVDDTPTYVYDDRGLRVRSDSVSKVPEYWPQQEPKEKQKSPEPVTYEYDERGLRVPVKKGHMRGASTPAVMETTPDQDQHTKGQKLTTTSSGGYIKDDILASNRKSTAYRAQQYSTDSSRGYWKQKDKEHIEFDEKRRKSQEQIFHRRHSSSSGDYTAKMAAMHPLLRAEEDSAPASGAAEDSEPGSVFERIDASKLQGALANASVMTNLEHEGVPTHLLPAIAQGQAEAKAQAKALEEEKKKQKKAPPAPKAQANFDFQGKNEKELSFNKGDFIDLQSRVDENWLEGSIGSRQGMFPVNYVKLLSLAEYQELVSPKPPTPTVRAVALFDYEGQTDRELTFNKGDIVTIDSQVDANWYSGSYGDKKGIFPVAYVELVEQ